MKQKADKDEAIVQFDLLHVAGARLGERGDFTIYQKRGDYFVSPEYMAVAFSLLKASKRGFHQLSESSFRPVFVDIRPTE